MIAALVKIDVAAVFLKRPTRQVFDLADGGSTAETGLLWVFNLAYNLAGPRRDLRFWLPEVQARAAGQPTQYHHQDIDWILSQILPGGRQSFNAGYVDQLLQIRERTRNDYGSQLPGKQVSRRNVYSRAALESFLRRRWIGGGWPVTLKTANFAPGRFGGQDATPAI